MIIHDQQSLRGLVRKWGIDPKKLVDDWKTAWKMIELFRLFVTDNRVSTGLSSFSPFKLLNWEYIPCLDTPEVIQFRPETSGAPQAPIPNPQSTSQAWRIARYPSIPSSAGKSCQTRRMRWCEPVMRCWTPMVACCLRCLSWVRRWWCVWMFKWCVIS